MTAESIPMHGEWQKITQSDCSRLYPQRIRFADNGLYFGEADPPGSFTTWDVGTYELTGETEIRLSTANDEVVAYQVQRSANQLRIIDLDGCEFVFERIP